MRKRNLDIEEYILDNLRDNPTNITQMIIQEFNVSRQTANNYLIHLINDKKVKATGNTKAREYHLLPIIVKEFTYMIQPTLEEDRVWLNDIAIHLEDIEKSAKSICQYCFTEIFNNAISHSEGTQIYVELKRYYDLIEMVIKDNGIGIFTKIQQDCHLDDPLQAIFELAKGKLTTEPEDHTGEGIFFVSRMCNGFLILSHELSFGHNEYDVDVMLEETDSEDWDGTIVWMKILPKKHKNMQKVFKKYSADGDFGFTKTIIPVSLAKYGDENLVSRSQAKRIMYRFEKFKAVVLDFQNVEIIGQSFADEIFRVYKNKNPDLNIVYINANKSVEDMIKHVELNTK